MDDDSKSLVVSKGILYIVLLIICTIIVFNLWGSDELFFRIDIPNKVRNWLYNIEFLQLSAFAGVAFVFPGWFLSQLLFRKSHVIRNFFIFSSIPVCLYMLFIMILILLSGDNPISIIVDGLEDPFIRIFVNVAVAAELQIIVFAIIGKVLSKRIINIIIGCFFIIFYLIRGLW